MKFFKRKKKEIECDCTMSELKEKGISLFDFMVKQMVDDGYINKEGKIEYPSD